MAAPLAAQTANPHPAVSSAESRGYRLRGYQWDPILGQRWAVLEDAAHPERPLLAELVALGKAEEPTNAAALNPPVPASVPPPVPTFVPPPRPSPPAVRAGETVSLWRDEANLRMQLAATADSNAAIGERVRLHVTGAGVYGSTGWQITGIVRGPGSVEMEQ